MALVDYEAAWLALADEVSSKQGIGRDALFALMKRLEVEHKLEEGVAERALRRYGISLSEDLRAAARGEEVVGDAASTPDGQDPAESTKSVPGDGKPMIETGESHDHRRTRRADERHRAAA